MLTLQQLVTPQTEDEVLASSLTILQQLGFQATSWQSGSAQLTFLRLIARIISALTTTVAQIAAGGFTTLASNAYLRLLAKYFYAIDYLPAQPTIGLMIPQRERTALTLSPALLAVRLDHHLRCSWNSKPTLPALRRISHQA